MKALLRTRVLESTTSALFRSHFILFFAQGLVPTLTPASRTLYQSKEGRAIVMRVIHSTAPFVIAPLLGTYSRNSTSNRTETYGKMSD